MKALYSSLPMLLAYHGISAHAQRPFSERMIESIVGRQQGILSSGQSTSTLESGFLALTLAAATELHPEQEMFYSAYADQVLEISSASLGNATKDALLPLDRLSVGSAIKGYANTHPLSDNQSSAATALARSLEVQKRNDFGGYLYYAGAYPSLSYLDGVFSLLPYAVTQPSPNYTDLSQQISLLVSHCYQASSGLPTHGYDANFTYPWADPVTGRSPFVWGRSLGWFMGGLVQAHEAACVGQVSRRGGRRDTGPKQFCSQLRNTFKGVAENLVKYADNNTGAWYQLTALPEEPGNYLESSSTLLFVWTLLKAIRLKIVGDVKLQDDVRKAATKAYQYAVDNFVTYYNDDGSFAMSGAGNGTIGINKTVAVCSLNSSATYDYYTGRPILLNSLLGESAFIMASLEMERSDI